METCCQVMKVGRELRWQLPKLRRYLWMHLQYVDRNLELVGHGPIHPQIGRSKAITNESPIRAPTPPTASELPQMTESSTFKVSPAQPVWVVDVLIGRKT
jgi:hypothetical protein